jgi:hypothetical protein
MPGNDAHLVIPAHHNMTAFLTRLIESDFCENLDGFIA